MPTYYVIKEIYYKEKRESLKGKVKCGSCGTNVPKFVIETITHTNNAKSIGVANICVKCAPSYFDQIKPWLISKSMAVKLKNVIDRRETNKYAKLCLIVQKG